MNTRWNNAFKLIQRHFMPLGVTPEDQKASFLCIAEDALNLGCLAEVEEIITRGTFYKRRPGVIGFDQFYAGGTGKKEPFITAPDILNLPVWVEINMEYGDDMCPLDDSSYRIARMRLRDAIRA